MKDIKDPKQKKTIKNNKDKEIKETKDESEIESDNEEENEEQLKAERAKKLSELERTLADIEKKINELRTEEEIPLNKKKLETLLKLKKSLLFTKSKLVEVKPSSIWDSIIIFIGLLLLCTFLIFSKLNEEYYSNFNWGDGKNLYTILDIPESSSKEQIKKRYRELVTKYHPDKNPGCEECPQKFLDIQNAYEVLVDEDQRAIYDETNGFGNFLKSSATELTLFNYKNQVEDSKDIWIIMVYKNNDYPSEFFSSFWEDVVKSYPFIKFGRINYKTQPKLIRKLPYKVREFPVVFAYSSFSEPLLMEISLRGDVNKNFRKFILEAMSGDLNEITDIKNITSENFIHLEVNKSDYPLIMSNFYAKIFKEKFGIDIWVSLTDKRTNKRIKIKNNNKEVNFNYDELKSILPALNDYLSVNKIWELNKDNYLHFCKNRENLCLIVEKTKIQLIEYLVDESKEQAVKCLENRIGCDSSKLVSILSLDVEKQPKFFNSVNINFNIEGLLINNSSANFKQETLVMIDGINDINSHPFSSFISLKDLLKGLRIEEVLRHDNFNITREYIYNYFDTFLGFNIGFFLLVTGYFLLRKLKFSTQIALVILFGISIAWSIRETTNKLY